MLTSVPCVRAYADFETISDTPFFQMAQPISTAFPGQSGEEVLDKWMKC
jgi:hypothetical protein